MADKAALKVRIGLNSNGQADYPDFNSLPVVLGSGMDWSKYIDVNGSGWLYSCCGHRESEPGSPIGEQFGLILVPEQFATEAVANFPTTCERLTNADAETFYHKDHARDFDDEEIDEVLLGKLKAKQDLGIPLTPHERRAIDPRDEKVRGVRPNRRKQFRKFKVDRDITVVDP